MNASCRRSLEPSPPRINRQSGGLPAPDRTETSVVGAPFRARPVARASPPAQCHTRPRGYTRSTGVSVKVAGGSPLPQGVLFGAPIPRPCGCEISDHNEPPVQPASGSGNTTQVQTHSRRMKNTPALVFTFLPVSFVVFAATFFVSAFTTFVSSAASFFSSFSFKLPVV